jgi:iron complex transport system ATP-binding protein
MALAFFGGLGALAVQILGIHLKLEARHLDFGYGARQVGHDVSLSVEAGEVLCLLGPNGSGKTTLFKTLLGLLPSQGGEVLIDEVALRERARNEVARLVSYVPQAHAAFFPFTVEEVVLMGRTAHLAIFSSPSRRDREIAHAAIERMRLAHLADSIYTRISGGERQLALIARALAQDARIIVMDEPTANLDFGNQVRVMEHIQALARTGMGVLLSTHDPDQAFVCADRVAMLYEGKLARTGTPAQAITAESLRQLYGVDVEVTQVETASGTRRTACIPLLQQRR